MGRKAVLRERVSGGAAGTGGGAGDAATSSVGKGGQAVGQGGNVAGLRSTRESTLAP